MWLIGSLNNRKPKNIGTRFWATTFFETSGITTRRHNTEDRDLKISKQ